MDESVQEFLVESHGDQQGHQRPRARRARGVTHVGEDLLGRLQRVDAVRGLLSTIVLRPDGYLFLGGAETTLTTTTRGSAGGLVNAVLVGR